MASHGPSRVGAVGRPAGNHESLNEIAVFERHVDRLDAVAKAKPPQAHASASISELRQHVRALLKHQSRRLLDLFRQWDSDATNTIDREEFEKAMSSLGVVKEAEVDALWADFDADSSGEITYNELLATLDPSHATANPTAQARDPNNQRHDFRYNRHDQEAAAKLIERDEGVRDVPYAHQRKIDSQTAAQDFEASLRNDSVDPNAKYQPKEKAVGRMPGMQKLDTSKGNVRGQLQVSMAKLAMTRLIDVFRAWDSDESGKISKKEFSAALATLGMNGDKEEVDRMFEEFDLNHDGELDYEELSKAIGPVRGGARGKTSRPPADKAAGGGRSGGGGGGSGGGGDGGSGGGGGATVGESLTLPPASLVDRVREKMLRRMGRVCDIFQALDKDHDHAISKVEFAQAMRMLHFSDVDIDEAWKIFDADGSGQIVYHELVAVLKPMVTAANPSKQAMDPNNQRQVFHYNRQDQQDAARLIERNSTRDTPYEEMERVRREQRNPRFR